MKRVILESPYAADENEIVRIVKEHGLVLDDCPHFVLSTRKCLIEFNVQYARACVRDSLMRGEAPIASHLLYTQLGILCDEIESERQCGIDAGLAWRLVADASVVYMNFGISKGMRYGIQAAMDAKILVEYRILSGFWAKQKFEKLLQNELTA